MKKVLGIAVLATVLLASCKKNYTCECTDVEIEGGTTTTTTSSFQIEEATSSQAQAACVEAKISTTQGGDTFERVCELKK